jgi:hypothetical protein
MLGPQFFPGSLSVPGSLFGSLTLPVPPPEYAAARR